MALVVYRDHTMPTTFDPPPEDVEKQLQEHPHQYVQITSSETGCVYYVSTQPTVLLDGETLQAINEGLDDISAGREVSAKPFIEALGTEDEA